MGKDLEESAALTLDWNKLDKVASKKCDVVPVVVQDTRTGSVLIAAYVNEVALRETFKQRVCCLWSTSRNELWVKGATSGDTLDLDDVRINCEQNSLLFLVTPRRKGACHTKDCNGMTRTSCYYRRVAPSLALEHMDVASSQHLPWNVCKPCVKAENVSSGSGFDAISFIQASLTRPSAATLAAVAVASSLATAAVLRR